jgi:hypothetical protein
MNKFWGWVVLGLAFLNFASCQSAPPKADTGGWDSFVEGYLDRYFAARPPEGVSAGRHEWDGQLPDWSKPALASEIAALKSMKARAATFTDASLNESQRFERDYLVSVTDSQLYWLEIAQQPFTNPQFYQGALDPNVYVSREYAPLADRLKAFIRYARAVPKACEQIRANLALPLARRYLDQGKLIFGGLGSYVSQDAVAAFAGVNDPALQADLKAATAQAGAAFKSLADWLESNRKTATEKFALGRDRFQKMLLDTERVSTPLAQIEKAGHADLDQNLATLKKICASFAPGKSLKACVANEESVKPKDAPVQAAIKQLDELQAFVREKDIVTIPGTEVATVAESPPYMRWNFAYIDIPGPYEKGLKSIYYIAPPDPKWSKKMQEDYIPGEGSLLDTSVHEVWPGHFLQFLHANRSRSKFGRVFVGYAFAEGWAHYVEELMSEVSLRGGDPKAQIGQLLGALERDVRLLSAIGLHTGKMTQAQSEKMFREKALMDAGSARQQAARGTFDPAYLNYTMGKLMIRKLRADWTASHCAADASAADLRSRDRCWKKFHDQFLAFGGPPIPLVRRAMMGADGPLF